MTVGITCQECGEEVVFWINGTEKHPIEECDCGEVYQLKAKQLSRPKNHTE